MQKEQSLFQLHAYKQGKCDSHTDKLRQVGAALDLHLGYPHTVTTQDRNQSFAWRETLGESSVSLTCF